VLWVDAPAWFVSVVGFATAVLVFAKGNAPVEPDAVRAVRASRSGV
jgi:hypothetical protein